MATTKVGIYRSYHGPIPIDSSGRPLPESEWPKKRAHSWVVRWFGADGERYSRSCETRKEADRLAEEKQAQVRDGKSSEPQKLTLKEFGKMYMRIRTDLTERSREEHERAIRYLRERFGDGRMLHTIGPLDARQFVAWYRTRKVKDRSRKAKGDGKPVSPSTVNKVMRECRRIFREAVDCELLRSNPFARIRQEKVAQVPWHHVTPEEFQRLMDRAPSARWEGLLSLAYCCGLRLGEILNLTWDDVDFQAARLRVVAKRGGAAEDWSPKDKDLRVVPLPKPAAVALTRLKLAAPNEQIYVVVRASGPQAGQRMHRKNIWRDFDAIRRGAKVPPCCMHDLRRSYCTNLARAMPMHVVQELAGHSDIRTTRRYYVSVQPELLDEARRAVERSLAC